MPVPWIDLAILSWCHASCRVITDMGNSGSEAFDGKAAPTLSAEDSIKCQLKLIDSADLSKSGKYFAHTGEPLPW